MVRDLSTWRKRATRVLGGASTRDARRGSVLVEFSFVAFLLYLLIAVLLDLGRGSLAVQTLQGAADLMAQELASAPLRGTDSFEDALADPYVKQRIYDEDLLVVELTNETPEQITALFATFPLVNQLLRPLMIEDVVSLDGAPRRVLRYPGAMVERGGGLTVLVPYVLERNYYDDASDAERVAWLPVVEEVKQDPAEASHFAIDAAHPLRGVVNVRINYPYQASMLAAYDSRVELTGPQHAAVAEDATVAGDPLPAGYDDLAVDADSGDGAYAGRYGLGVLHPVVVPGVTAVRPFRKLIAAQAAARREVVFVPLEGQ